MPKRDALLPGITYHIYNRGANSQQIFLEERNYRYFLRRYAEFIEPVAFTYAYCLLGNHFHFAVRIKSDEEQKEFAESQTYEVSKTSQVFVPRNPSRQFGHLFNAYTRAINVGYGRTGSLFDGRFKRIPVTTQDYLTGLIAYIHRNPQKHAIVADFREWPYSSYGAIISKKPTRVHRQEVLDWFGSPTAFAEAHQFDDEGPIQHLIADDFA